MTTNKELEINDFDMCPKCGKEINLALPHGWDYELQRPMHRECKDAQVAGIVLGGLSL